MTAVKVISSIAILLLSGIANADIRLWTSSTTTTGNIGGRAGADAICDGDGNKPTVASSTTRAFISISASDEIRDMATNYNIPTSETVYSSNGSTTIASNFAALLNTGSTDLNNPVGGGSFIWTFTNSDGSLGTNNCNAGTSGAVFASGIMGHSIDFDADFLSQLSGNVCSASQPLYCITYTAPAAPASSTPLVPTLLGRW